MADERTYSYYSRVIPIEHAALPSFLYFFVFSATRSCGEDGLACARLFNALFFALSLPLVFLVARRYAAEWASFLITALVALGPAASYTAYFMPEAMYFFGVWLFLVALTSRSPGWPNVVGAGVTLGLLSLVKLHALFLLPGALLLLVLREAREGRWQRGLGSASIALAIAVTLRFGLGFALAGAAGLSIVGPQYSAHEVVARTLAELLSLSLRVGWAHVQAIALLFALPLFVILAGASRAPSSDERSLGLGWVTVILIVPLVLITALFTAHVSGGGELESLGRIHMRYYNFLTPLLSILAAASLKAGGQFNSRRGVAALIAFALASIGFVGRSTFQVSVCDCPELQGLNSSGFIIGSVGGLLAVALAAFKPREGALLWVCVALPLLTLSASQATTKDLLARKTPTTFDVGAKVARAFLAPEELERLEVVVPADVDGFRVLFTLNNRTGRFHVQADDQPVTQLSPDREWVLIFGRPPVEGRHRVVLEANEFSLVRFE